MISSLDVLLELQAAYLTSRCNPNRLSILRVQNSAPVYTAPLAPTHSSGWFLCLIYLTDIYSATHVNQFCKAFINDN